MKPAIEFIDMDREELNQLVERARAALSQEDYRKVKGMAEALTYLTDLVGDQQTTIRDLRELMFPASTEKTEAVLKQAGVEPTSKSSNDQTGAEKPKAQNPKPPGHGRNGAEEYRNGQRVQVAHASLKHGDRCPGCQKGKVYEQQEPWRLVLVAGGTNNSGILSSAELYNPVNGTWTLTGPMATARTGQTATLRRAP